MMETTLTKKTYKSIDIAKFIMSIFVVTIHARPVVGNAGEFYISEVVARIAVPFFFVATGFFFFKKITFANNGKIEKSKENLNKLLQYEKRIIILYILWSIVYFFVEMFKYYQKPVTERIPLLHQIISFGIAFFKNGSYYHLWYIVCLIYGIPLLYLLLRLVKVKSATLFGLFLYAVKMLIEPYSFLFTPLKTIGELFDKTGCVGTSIFTAIPFMLIGVFYIDKINDKRKNICLTCSIICFVLLIVEASFLHFFISKDISTSYLFSLIPFSFFLFGWIRNVECKKISNDVSVMLRNMSTIVYCVHPLIIEILKRYIKINNSESLMGFVFALIISLLVAIIISVSSKKFSILKYSF